MTFKHFVFVIYLSLVFVRIVQYVAPLLPPAVYSVQAASPVGELTPNLLPVAVLSYAPQSSNLPPGQVSAYIAQQALIYGVNPKIAQFIVAHESQNGQNLLGDDNNSRGVWMISKIYHPEVSDSCAFDLQCSTAWSLKWILAGHISEWTTWRMRCSYYSYDSPPNC